MISCLQCQEKTDITKLCELFVTVVPHTEEPKVKRKLHLSSNYHLPTSHLDSRDTQSEDNTRLLFIYQISHLLISETKNAISKMVSFAFQSLFAASAVCVAFAQPSFRGKMRPFPNITNITHAFNANAVCIPFEDPHCCVDLPVCECVNGTLQITL